MVIYYGGKGISIISLSCSVCGKDESGIPVLIWSNYEDISFPAISSIDYLPMNSFMEDILMKTRQPDVKLIVFVQEKLSLEDFTSHSSNQLHSLDTILNTSLSSYFLTNVENPMIAIEKIGDGNVKIMNNLDHFNQGITDDKVVIVDLPLTNGLMANDVVIGKMAKEIDKTQGKSIVMLTGRENSYADKEIHRVARHILADPSSSKEKEDEGYVTKVPSNDPCLFFHITGGSFLMKIYDNQEKSRPRVSYSSSFPAKPTSSDGKCSEYDDEGKEKVPASLKLTWTGLANQSSLSLTFTINVSKRGKWWNVRDIEANFNNRQVKKNMFLNAEKLEASTGFSFSCSKLSLCNDWNVTDETDETFTYFIVNLKRYQLQPFKSAKPEKTFEDSFDCSTFFTIPLWMGFFTILLFIMIVSIGVFLLMELTTMDRFENPKGKTITINVND